MSEISRVLGAKSAIKVIDREYLLPPIQLRHLAAAQNEMRNHRSNVIRESAEAAAGLPETTQRILLEAATAEYAKQHTIPLAEAMLWATQSIEGIAFVLWIMIDECGAAQPLPSRRDIRRWLESLPIGAEQGILEPLLRASGEDAMGNGDGGQSTNSTGPKQPPASSEPTADGGE